MTTLYQKSDDQLERLRDRLILRAESNSSDTIEAEAAEIVEKERRWGLEPAPPDVGSGAQVVAEARRLVTEELSRRVGDRRLADVLQKKIDAENDKPDKARAVIVNPHHASTWPGDAKVWMEVAVGLDQSNRGLGSDMRDHHKSNVAHVATGFAFELAYKALLVGEFEPFLQKHSCELLHKRLAPDTQAHLEAVMIENGWPTAIACVKYLDERMSNADRKYWMVNPNRARWTRVSKGTSFFLADGPMAIARLGQVLITLLPLVTGKLSQARRAWDYWMRTQHPPLSLE